MVAGHDPTRRCRRRAEAERGGKRQIGCWRARRTVTKGEGTLHGEVTRFLQAVGGWRTGIRQSNLVTSPLAFPVGYIMANARFRGKSRVCGRGLGPLLLFGLM